MNRSILKASHVILHSASLLPFVLAVLMLFLPFSPAMADRSASIRILASYYETMADELFQSRELPGNLQLAIGYYQKSLQLDPAHGHAEWKLSRCYWSLASKTDDVQQRSLYFGKGIQYGEMAVENNPENSYAHSWLALNTGSRAINQGVVNTLYNRDIIKKELETAIRLDAENTNAYAGLAAWYFHVPAILGGDRKTAFEMIDHAIDLEPDYTAPILLKAEFLISEQRIEEARQSLQRILAIERPAVRGDGVEDKIKAQRLLQKLNADPTAG